MLRVNSSNVLVVPPFECAWLSDEARQFKENAGCVSFEVKGENDATLIFKSKPGSRRWQHMELGGANAGLAVDHHYTVVFGSHQNSCLKIERDSQECYRIEQVASISGNSFVKCWVDYNNGNFKLGTGKPGSSPSFAWTDSDPIRDIQHLGLGSWDKHVCFRNIQMRPPLVQRSLAHTDQTEEPQQMRSEVPSLVSLCKEVVVETVSPGSVCSALSLVDLFSPALDAIAPTLVSFLARNLEQTLQADPCSFHALPALMIAEMLGNPCLECSERIVFGAVMHWAYASEAGPLHRLTQSVADVEGLLLLIRFPLMSQADLERLRSHEFTQQSPMLAELISEAMQAHSHHPGVSEPGADLAVEDQRHVKACTTAARLRSVGRFQQRHAPTSQNLMFVSNGDKNGVSHWLGTCYGTQNWVNPALAGMMQVQASSPSCKHTDPKAVVSGNFVRLNLAGPSKSGTWWQVDLGASHRLTCDYYTIRHDGSFDYPRSWVLQASNNGVGWVDLSRHENDWSISMPGQSLAWPVSSHAASMPYRIFRVLLTGPNTSPTGKNFTLHLSCFELYGHFFQI